MTLRLQLKVAQFVGRLDGAEGRDLNGVQYVWFLPHVLDGKALWSIQPQAQSRR